MLGKSVCSKVVSYDFFLLGEMCFIVKLGIYSCERGVVCMM